MNQISPKKRPRTRIKTVEREWVEREFPFLSRNEIAAEELILLKRGLQEKLGKPTSKGQRKRRKAISKEGE